MDRTIGIIQIAISALLIVSILLQNRGAEISETFGGGSGSGNVYQTKRGFDKFLFSSTIIFAFLFLATALYSFIKY